MLEFEWLHFFIKLIYYLLLTVVIRDTLDYLSLILFKIIGRYLISLIQKYETLTRNITLTVFFLFCFVFFYQGFSFTQHSQFTEQQGMGRSFVTPIYHFHLLHEHLDIRRAITADKLPLHIGDDRTQTKNL